MLGDSLTVATYDTGGAEIVEAWGINSDHALDIAWYYTRPESTHDTTYGLRVFAPALYPGGAGTVGAHNLLPGPLEVPVFKADTPSIKTTSTAADDVILSYLTRYDNLPGATGSIFANWQQVQALRKSNVSIYVNPTGSSTPGVYGVARAFTADDNRWIAGTWYALVGFTFKVPFTTVAFKGPENSFIRTGAPGGVVFSDRTPFWFAELSSRLNVPLIPCFQGTNAALWTAEVADGEVSTAPALSLNCVQLVGPPS